LPDTGPGGRKGTTGCREPTSSRPHSACTGPPDTGARIPMAPAMPGTPATGLRTSATMAALTTAADTTATVTSAARGITTPSATIRQSRRWTSAGSATSTSTEPSWCVTSTDTVTTGPAGYACILTPSSAYGCANTM